MWETWSSGSWFQPSSGCCGHLVDLCPFTVTLLFKLKKKKFIINFLDIMIL